MVFLPWAPIQNVDRNRIVREIAQRYDATPRQIVLRLAAGPIAVDPADPGHRIGVTRRRQRRRRGDQAGPGRCRLTNRQRRLRHGDPDRPRQRPHVLREAALSLLDLSRRQFAITVLFHMTFPSITVGLSIFLCLLYGLYWKTGNPTATPRKLGRSSGWRSS